jgi:hypothetical protein
MRVMVVHDAVEVRAHAGAAAIGEGVAGGADASGQGAAVVGIGGGQQRGDRIQLDRGGGRRLAGATAPMVIAGSCRRCGFTSWLPMTPAPMNAMPAVRTAANPLLNSRLMPSRPFQRGAPATAFARSRTLTYSSSPIQAPVRCINRPRANESLDFKQ